MELSEFVKCFSNELEDTPVEDIMPQTVYKKLKEWDSLTSLSIISMVDDELEKEITSANLRSWDTIEELYNFIITLN